MKKLLILTSILFFCGFNNSHSQSVDIFEIKKSNKLQRIKFTDSLLITKIDSFINNIKNTDSLFKKKGYITIKIINKNSQVITEDTTIKKCLYISFSYMQYFINEDDIAFPNYYTYFKKKLILISEDNDRPSFSEKFNRFEKKKIIRLTKKYIEDPKFLIINDINKSRIKIFNRGRMGYGSGFYFCYPLKNKLEPRIYKPIIY